MNAPAPIISAIVVSYNTAALTLRCLDALFADLGTMPAEVLVVDNGSTDASVSEVRSRFPQAIVLENGANLGFGAANNIAMKQATGKYLLLINSDAFVRPGAIAAMVARAQADPQLAVIGPRIVCTDGSLQLSCFRFTTPARAWMENLWLSQLFSGSKSLGDYRRWPHDRERIVDFVIGACMLVRADAYRQVGGFDENFFMYSEESDWQWRMKRAGWMVAFTPAASVEHIGGASGIGEKARINRHFFESLDLYTRKHHGIFGLISLRAAMAVGCTIRTVLWAGAWIASPRRRRAAAAKIKLLSWLVVRQTTCWTTPLASPNIKVR